MIEQPNYTQIPNSFLDEQMRRRDMGIGELKVCLAIARQTFGWHKEGDRLSLSQLEELTGLSRQGVINGINAAIKNGLIVRTQKGQGYIYSLNVVATSQVSRPVDNTASQVSRPELVKEVDQFEPKLVKLLDTQKKDTKKRKEKELLAAQALPLHLTELQPIATESVTEKETPTPSAAAPLPLHEQEELNEAMAALEQKQTEKYQKATEQQRKFQLLCNIVGWDYKILSKEQTGQVAQTLGILCKAGYTEEHLAKFHDQVWSKDWRWQQHHSYPSLAQVRAEMGKLKLQQQVAATRTAAAVEQQTAIPQMLRMQQRKGFYTQ